MTMLHPDKKALLELATYKMPFGKYKDQYLIDIPEYYYTWFKNKGFPKGKLGLMMQQMYEIKINGLEELIYHIRVAKYITKIASSLYYFDLQG